MAQFIYHFLPGERQELATDPDSWTAKDEAIGTAHFERLSHATTRGQVVLAGRSLDGVGPAIVIFEAEDETEARAFMNEDPFVSEGLFRASLHPFRAALVRNP
jgi:uncharacterized protein YciI